MERMIRKANMADIESYIHLLHTVREEMPQKDWFYIDTPEEIRSMMQTGIMELWVAVDGNSLAGAFSAVIPGVGPLNYGHALGYSEEALSKVINMDTAVVHPHYRGMGLQRKLLLAAERELSGSGHRILLCTIHPHNSFSLNNAIKIGYRIQKELPMYGSVRYILRKDIF